MSAKSILEADGKAILNYHLTRAPVIKPTPLPASSTHNPPPKLASLYFAADADIKGVLDQAEVTYPWLLVPGAKFVAKPDQLIKRRGKSGLLALNKPWAEAREWIEARAGKEQKVETVDGVLRQFLVEPFVPHPQDTEYYININSVREVRFFFLRFVLYVVSLSFEASSRRRPCPGVHAALWHTSISVKGCCRSGSGRLAQSTRAHRLVLFDGRPDERKPPRPTHARSLSHANLLSCCPLLPARALNPGVAAPLPAIAQSCRNRPDPLLTVPP
jgi:hypothetical protein